ncbi:MAG: MarR family transcriptional regulator [Candidatus Omnitrophica bacterium]|nr:MarR family transcriptional regulator [Candidatus Omnitrophota bacterium]
MSHIPLPEFADRINEILPVLFREFSKRQANEFFKGKITMPQFLVLGFLYKQKEAKMSDLAMFMKVSTPAMTGTVDRMVRDGYVSRLYEANDRRIINIGLTAKGIALVKKIYEQRREMIINVFGKLTEKDREDYLRVLTQVHNVMVTENNVNL